jgi:hypothetical protein
MPEKMATRPNVQRQDLWYIRAGGNRTYIRSVITPEIIGVKKEIPNIDIACMEILFPR